MQVNFLVVDFRFETQIESEFQSSDCLQHTTMMLVYGSVLYGAPGSSLRGSVQLTCKKWQFKPWKGQVTDSLTQFRNQFLAVFGWFPRFWLVSPGFAGPRATADRRCAFRIDAQRQLWILNWHQFKPSGNLTPRQVALVAQCSSSGIYKNRL